MSISKRPLPDLYAEPEPLECPAHLVVLGLVQPLEPAGADEVVQAAAAPVPQFAQVVVGHLAASAALQVLQMGEIEVGEGRGIRFGIQVEEPRPVQRAPAQKELSLPQLRAEEVRAEEDAVSFGAHGAFQIARAMHVLSILLFIALGAMMHLHWPYFIGVAIAAATLVYQHRIVSADDYSRVTQRYFMRNGIVSIAMLIFTVASLYV